MNLKTALDDALADPLYEGPLELLPPAGRQRKRSLEANAAPPPNGLPIISMGRPRAWAMEELVSGQVLPSEIKASMGREKFFVVRLACSFRPQRDDVKVAWAQLTMDMKPDQAGLTPLAFDLYPRSVERERTVSKKISLSPSLNFSEIGASVGEFAYAVEYPAVEPLLTKEEGPHRPLCIA